MGQAELARSEINQQQDDVEQDGVRFAHRLAGKMQQRLRKG
jgi:hypothetical protein